jgi:ribosomal protein L12E/L44/L45/RPP1/RPP2
MLLRSRRYNPESEWRATPMLAKRLAFCQLRPIMKPSAVLLAALAMAFAAPVRAQPAPQPGQQQESGHDDAEDSEESKDEQTDARRFWQANLPGGHYMVALDRIASVSRHKYILDGAMVVDEVTVDAAGQALARFYFVTPITAGTRANTVAGLAGRAREVSGQLADRTGVDLQDMVVKKYPETSHARTIEYRILSERQLGALHQSVKTAWESGHGRRFTTR